MSFIPIQNGQHVVTRTLSWEQIVIPQWGDEWRRPDIAYEFGNGVKKESTDMFTTGFYKR